MIFPVLKLSKTNMSDLKDFKLDSVPSTCYYIPDFITEAEEKLLIHNIEKTSVREKQKLVEFIRQEH